MFNNRKDDFASPIDGEKQFFDESNTSGTRRIAISNLLNSPQPNTPTPRRWSGNMYANRPYSNQTHKYAFTFTKYASPAFGSGFAGMAKYESYQAVLHARRQQYGFKMTESYFALLPRLGTLLRDSPTRQLEEITRIGSRDLDRFVDDLLRVEQGGRIRHAGLVGLIRKGKLWLWSMGKCRYKVYYFKNGIANEMGIGQQTPCKSDISSGDAIIIVPSVIGKNTLDLFISSTRPSIEQIFDYLRNVLVKNHGVYGELMVSTLF